MGSVTYSSVTKRFGEVTAVDDLSLEIADGEFVVIVGPSGSGKTTALRLLAGLEILTEGEIRIGDRAVDRLAPKDRDIAMVFQDYALYPQMTVRQNLAFALRMRKMGRHDIDARIERAASMLRIGDLLERKPVALSGGQRQRVALGRALVREPEVFLMDEPLSNLDAKLRVQTRTEIKHLQEQVGTTTVYVTHDQVEAMTMGDRVAVMNEGVLEQVGAPFDVYQHPANVFVAGFIGSPAMGFARVQTERSGDSLTLRDGELSVTLDHARDVPPEVIVGVRPEHARLWNDDERLVGPIDATVEYVEMLGRETLVGVLAGADHRFAMIAPAETTAKPGDRIRFGVDAGRLFLFDVATERALGAI
jgi:multiple sugar transport system ATP-binding protein